MPGHENFGGIPRQHPDGQPLAYQPPPEAMAETHRRIAELQDRVRAAEAADRAPLQPVAEDYTLERIDVDPAGQAIVWALTASQHGTELLEVMHGIQERQTAESGVIEPVGTPAEMRTISYHRQAHKVASDLASMWSMVTGVQPDFLVTNVRDESGPEGNATSHVD